MVQIFVGVVQRTPVVTRQNEQPHHLRLVALQYLAHGKKIAQRFGHFFFVHLDEAVMHPEINVTMTAGRLGLGDLVLVMGKFQVHAPAVNIEMFAQAMGRHRRALDMPAGSARAPRRAPTWFTRFGGFPQHEVQRIALGLFHFDSRSRPQIVQLLVGQLPVALEPAHVVIHVTGGTDIGETLVQQGLNHGDHVGHRFGGARFLGRRQDAQRLQILMHGLDEAIGQGVKILAVLLGTMNDLIVDVGNVAHIGHVVTPGPQPTQHHVEHHHDPRVTDMTVVVDGHAAHVHPHLARLDGVKRFFLTGQAIENLQHK